MLQVLLGESQSMLQELNALTDVKHSLRQSESLLQVLLGESQSMLQVLSGESESLLQKLGALTTVKHSLACAFESYTTIRIYVTSSLGNHNLCSLLLEEIKKETPRSLM